MDACELFDFDIDRFRENVRLRNPDAEVICLSAKTGEGVDAWVGWLEGAVAAWKGGSRA